MTEVASVASSEAPSRCRQLLRAGDTVWSTVRPYLEKIAYIDEGLDEQFASTGFCVLRPGSAILPKYLFHYSVSRQMLDQVLVHQRGVSYPAVLEKNVKAAAIPVPPLDQQRRIIDILEDHLSRLDAAESTLHDALARRRLLHASFLQSIAHGPVETLENLAVESGYVTSTKCAVGGQGPAVVRIPNLVNGVIDLTDEKRAIDSSLDLTKMQLVEGDLLVVRTNGSRDLIGRAAVAQSGVDAAFASYLIRFRLDLERVRPQWVRLMLETPRTRSVLERMAASSAGQYNLGLKKLNGVGLHCPPVAEQDSLIERAADFQWGIEAISTSVEASRARGTSLRRALLEAAFSGKLTGHSDEMAGVAEAAGV